MDPPKLKPKTIPVPTIRGEGNLWLGKITESVLRTPSTTLEVVSVLPPSALLWSRDAELNGESLTQAGALTFYIEEAGCLRPVKQWPWGIFPQIILLKSAGAITSAWCRSIKSAWMLVNKDEWIYRPIQCFVRRSSEITVYVSIGIY